MDSQENTEIVPAGGESGAISSPGYPGYGVLQVPVSSSEFAWEDAVRILRKHWRLSVAFAAAVVIVATIVTFRMTPIYESVGTIEIDPPESQLLLKDLLNVGVEDQDYLHTQLQIIQSRELAVKVIRSLELDRLPEFAGKITSQTKQDESQASGATDLTSAEDRALNSFTSRFKVNLLQDTRVVEVHFGSQDPQLAAKIVNTLISTFVDQNYRTRYEATMSASEWLSAQLTELRQKVGVANQALVDYQKANGIVAPDMLNNPNNGINQKIAAVTQQLVQAQVNRITLEAQIKLARSSENPAAPNVRRDELIQALSERLADTKARLIEAQSIYGPNSPNLLSLQSQAKELEHQVAVEKGAVADILEIQLRATEASEKMLSEQLSQLNQLVGNLNDKMIQYNVLRQEAQTNQDLYNSLLAKLKEAGVSAGLRSSNIRVVDQASVLKSPTRPRRALNIAISLLVGITGGILLAFVKERLEDTLQNPEDVKRWTGLVSLALVPELRRLDEEGAKQKSHALADKPSREVSIVKLPPSSGRPWLFLEDPLSPEAEAMRSLRTSVLLSAPHRPPQVLCVVSASPQDGKTTVAINLASVLAENAATCLLDCDMRRPRLEKVFDLNGNLGLTNILTGSRSWRDAVVSPFPTSKLSVLPVGPVPPNPGALVASDAMRHLIGDLRQEFAFVVIDTPPLLHFADARELAANVDGVVLVARYGFSTRQEMSRATEILAGVRAPILGVVINGIDYASVDYRYYHYGYGSYRYGYGYKSAYGRNGASSRPNS